MDNQRGNTSIIWYTRGMNTGKSKATPINRVQNWGLYVWRMPDGSFLSDGQGNFMNIGAMRNDITAMAKLRQAAKHFGIEVGEPVFLAGTNRVSDEEYSVQRDRFAQGLIPSETDLGAWMDAEKGARKHGTD